MSREFVVAIRCSSAAVFREVDPAEPHDDDGLCIRASDDELSVEFRTVYEDGAPRWLHGWVRARADSIDEAAALYGHTAAAYLHILSVASNAAIALPHLVTVYEATAGDAPCMVQRLGAPAPPLTSHRTLNGRLAVQLLDRAVTHPKEARLRRAMEHYAQALRGTDPASPLDAANTLFIAAETLTPVVVERLMREGDFGTKGEWAASLGFGDLNAADAEARRSVIFGGEDNVYEELKRMSHGFEHGFEDFGTSRERAARAALPAAALIRAAILRESGLAEDTVTALLGGIHERPLPLWPTRVFAAGRLHASAEQIAPNATPVMLDVEATPRVVGYDPDTHGAAVEMDLHVRATVDRSPTFDAFKWTLNGPGEFELQPQDADESEPGDAT